MRKNGHNSASIFNPKFEIPKCFLFDTHFGGAYANIYACFERKNRNLEATKGGQNVLTKRFLG